MIELKEHGFFDYLSPCFGGLEKFQRDDFLRLLDDMAAAGMNSLHIGIRGQTTGWRSNLPYLDQLAGCPNIESDNRIVREVIEQAHRRSIRVWFTVCVNRFVAGPFGLTPVRTWDSIGSFKLPFTVGQYDSDLPGILDRAVEISREVVELFPGLDGLTIEAENMCLEMPHRIPLYDRWAAENGRRPFAQLGHPLWGKTYDVPEWRDYTTYSKARIFQAVAQAVGEAGFRGGFATYCEVGARYSQYSCCQAVNIKYLLELCPGWIAVTYQYEKWMHRWSMAEFCMVRPKEDGAVTYYLPRGVMTVGDAPGQSDHGPGVWPLPISLAEHWRRDVEDIERFAPDGVWWFGAGTRNDGPVISLSRLRRDGFRDDHHARAALLKAASPLRAPRPT